MLILFVLASHQILTRFIEVSLNEQLHRHACLFLLHMELLNIENFAVMK